jgi:hypothetical protein
MYISVDYSKWVQLAYERLELDLPGEKDHF